MAAKDYKICPALFDAYIAKTSKKNPNEMLSDRRIITDSEIFSLIQWRLERHCIEDENTNGMVISVGGKPILEIIPKGELLEKLQKIIKKDKENDDTCAEDVKKNGGFKIK